MAAVDVPREEPWKKKGGKLAELIAEAEFMQQRQMAENRAEQLRVQEKLAKAKARSEVYEAIERKESEFDKSEIIRGSKVDTGIGQQEIVHKHQVKSAAADNNIQAPLEKLVTTMKKMVGPSQNQQ